MYAKKNKFVNCPIIKDQMVYKSGKFNTLKIFPLIFNIFAIPFNLRIKNQPSICSRSYL